MIYSINGDINYGKGEVAMNMGTVRKFVVRGKKSESYN